MTSVDGVEFENAWSKQMDIDMEGLTIPVIGRKHLIQNKRALGRSQDLADIERLQNDDS